MDAGKKDEEAYSEEQAAIVREIINKRRKKKDYYEILGLEKTCSVDDIRKAYRKLSLKVHPDKNQAPGAEEAFKLVSKAFQCLSGDARKTYDDVVGPERRTARPRHQGFYYDDGDADEIIRNFNQRAPSFSSGHGLNVRMVYDDGSSRDFNLSAPNFRSLLVNILKVFIRYLFT